MSAYTTDNLQLVWEAAKASPFEPLVAQGSLFPIAFALLIAGMTIYDIQAGSAVLIV
jgi:hypothetical protein